MTQDPSTDLLNVNAAYRIEHELASVYREALREAYSQLTDGEGLGPDLTVEAVDGARDTLAKALVFDPLSTL